ncbi:MAG: bifunctional oligoribonuclease/PAP phosphatase NrnA [Anaerolineae bacterium]|nr:bifunctional oligoribonuclease/PAP phosphatase NrnA [Anaerolineae bacterium]
MMMEWDKAAALLSQAQYIVIVTHVGPDGDAIGSLLGLMWALRRLGKRVVPAVDEGVPPEFTFLPGAEEVRAALGDVQPDLVIAVDCGDPGRMGKAGEAARAAGAPLINLDHHITNTRFGDANLVDPATVASAEGVLDWLDRLGVAPDRQIATCLLTGIVTDTLCFRTDNVSAAVFGKAQRLIEAGAPYSEITQRTVMRMSFEALGLWAAVLPRMRLEEEGILWVAIDRPTRQALNYNDARDGGLVSLLISADRARIAAVFREKDDGKVEIGFRAVPGYDVATVAARLGGGGHALAAGCTIDGPLEEAVARTLALLREAAREGAPVVP